MVHGLRFGEPGNGRQDAEGVAGKENDVLRVTGLAREVDVRDVRDRVARAGIFGERLIVEVQCVAFFVEHHVFEHGAEAAGGRENFRLALRVEADDLGVTAAFDVEDAVVAPAVFVVADQHPLRIGREGGFAGAREAEEKGHVGATFTRGVVGAAVHGQDAAFGQHVVHDREDALLDFAGILRAADEHQALREVEQNEGRGAGAVAFGHGEETRHVDDGEVGPVVEQLGAVGFAHEHVLGEEVLPCVLVDDTHVDAVPRIGTGIAVEHEKIAALEVALDLTEEAFETFRLDCLVDGAPPDVRFAARFFDHKFVVRRTAGVHSGVGHQRAFSGDVGFPTGDGLFVEAGRRQVPVDGAGVGDAVDFEAVAADERTGILHHKPLGNGSPSRVVLGWTPGEKRREGVEARILASLHPPQTAPSGSSSGRRRRGLLRADLRELASLKHTPVRPRSPRRPRPGATVNERSGFPPSRGRPSVWEPPRGSGLRAARRRRGWRGSGRGVSGTRPTGIARWVPPAGF